MLLSIWQSKHNAGIRNTELKGKAFPYIFHIKSIITLAAAQKGAVSR